MNTPPGRRIYPVFLPHAGCPFQCIYCNQRAVTSSRVNSFGAPDGFIADVENMVSELARNAEDSEIPGEIAFYGGTFTALPPDVLRTLLAHVAPFVRKGVFTGIRFSTRPDSMSHDVCSLLDKYPVSTVELGIQSLSDQVLSKSRRGYTAETVRSAAAVVKEHGWNLGAQLMIGLPGDDFKTFLESVRCSISLAPEFVRLYPTLVLTGAELADRYRKGLYIPPTLEEAIDQCVAAVEICEKAGVEVARLGLQSDPQLDAPGVVIAGPHHPSFGFLVRVRQWRNRVDEILAQAAPRQFGERRLVLRVGTRFLSEVAGPKRINILHWTGKWWLEALDIETDESWTERRLDCEWVSNFGDRVRV